MRRIVCFALVWLPSAALTAQEPPRRGVGADEFFEQFIPQPSETDEKALADIKVSQRDEERYGGQMVQAYLSHLKRQNISVVRRGPDVEYLRALIEQVQPQMRNAQRYAQIEVYVVDSSEIDARSFPGGHLFFYKGLLEVAGNEAALVAVIGHELSHLDHGHQLVPLKQSRLMQNAFTPRGPGFDPQRFFSSGMSMMRIMSRPFRPQDEAAADRDGTAWAYAVGYDSRELAKLLIRMHEQQRGRELAAMPAFFRTHPPTLERSRAVLEQFDELRARRPRTDPYIGRENLEQRIPRPVKEFPE
jgi:predicted Zn-dependent protease